MGDLRRLLTGNAFVLGRRFALQTDRGCGAPKAPLTDSLGCLLWPWYCGTTLSTLISVPHPHRRRTTAPARTLTARESRTFDAGLPLAAMVKNRLRKGDYTLDLPCLSSFAQRLESSPCYSGRRLGPESLSAATFFGAPRWTFSPSYDSHAHPNSPFSSPIATSPHSDTVFAYTDAPFLAASCHLQIETSRDDYILALSSSSRVNAPADLLVAQRVATSHDAGFGYRWTSLEAVVIPNSSLRERTMLMYCLCCVNANSAL
ncbi:hypothetical protein HMN09_00784200 [Mycena chlorophos]|uniref:Uncharacterized protein n=1 Tax=Mycena chlorophos TaxID=658473 RepID=A0A8H6W4F0_MYCCL|nr:hypothetical protein HMN09_00784200 [Mycena chlorophos]